MLKITLSLIVIMVMLLSTLAGCVHEVVAPAPPPPKPEVKPSPPFPGAVWVQGHWERRHGEWIWTPGRWKRVP